EPWAGWRGGGVDIVIRRCRLGKPGSIVAADGGPRLERVPEAKQVRAGRRDRRLTDRAAGRLGESARWDAYSRLCASSPARFSGETVPAFARAPAAGARGLASVGPTATRPFPTACRWRRG